MLWVNIIICTHHCIYKQVLLTDKPWLLSVKELLKELLSVVAGEFRFSGHCGHDVSGVTLQNLITTFVQLLDAGYHRLHQVRVRAALCTFPFIIEVDHTIACVS